MVFQDIPFNTGMIFYIYDALLPVIIKIEKLTKDKKGELITELFPTENENDEQE